MAYSGCLGSFSTNRLREGRERERERGERERERERERDDDDDDEVKKAYTLHTNP